MPLEITSIFDKIAQAVSPLLRQLSDVKVEQTGTKTSVLRLTKTSQNAFGDQRFVLESSIIDDVIIYYPLKDMETFASKEANQSLKSDALDLTELLPVTMHIKFKGDPNHEAFSIQANDIVVDTLFDENDNILPIILQVTRITSTFNSKFVVKRTYELSLFRGTMEDDIQEEVNQFIDSILRS